MRFGPCLKGDQRKNDHSPYLDRRDFNRPDDDHFQWASRLIDALSVCSVAEPDAFKLVMRADTFDDQLDDGMGRAFLVLQWGLEDDQNSAVPVGDREPF